MLNLEVFFFADEYCFYRNVAAIIGVLWLAVVVVSEVGCIISGVRAYFLAPCGVGGSDLKKYGRWAVITGASEGIGRGYALELAKRGLNVVLMSRSREKLQKVADEIKDQYKRDVLIIPVDFSSDYDIYKELSNQLKGLDIGILVNNVGMFYGIPNAVCDVAPEVLYSTTQVNSHPVVQMCHIVLPGMLKKKGGVIVNISSTASKMAMPLMTVYSATKIFTNYISDGIRKEYGSSGIIVQNVTPLFVATAMTAIKKSSFFIPDAITYSRSAVSTIGIQDSTYGCVPHAIQGFILKIMPSFLRNYLGSLLISTRRERRLRKERIKSK